MPKTMKICRVCGKEYEYCHTAKSNPNVFRWQDVACSPECGSTYLSQIRASRKKKDETTETAVSAETAEAETTVSDSTGSTEKSGEDKQSEDAPKIRHVSRKH